MKLDPEVLLVGLEEDRVSKLRRFAAILAGRGADLGMVSRGDRSRVWERHVLDSLRLLACLSPHERSLADVGSGAGLPGVPIAVALPEVSVTLVEPRSARVGFLEMVVQELGLYNVRVVQGRAEEMSERFQVCAARALADPERTWALASPLLQRGGRVFYFAGHTFTESDHDLPEAVGFSAKICRASLFPGYGSIVIMQSDP